MTAQNLNNNLVDLVRKLEGEEKLISEQRKTELSEFAKNINQLQIETGYANVLFICTHNSRRSQLGQLWLRAATKYYGIKGIHTFSGGTESTAFNYRMVLAVERAGFHVEKMDERDNPKYLIWFSESDQNMDIYFSKKYDDGYNPGTGFIAVMVCTDADEACPVVPGADTRISLPYLDPKSFDDSPEESKAYDDKVLEIGREMLFVARNLVNKLELI